jgi:hypothetical protein
MNNNNNSKQQFEALGKYAQDLTKAAEEGLLDPVIGRDEEIRGVIGVLARRRKNNPCLIGEPGMKAVIKRDYENFLILIGFRCWKDSNCGRISSTHIERRCSRVT